MDSARFDQLTQVIGALSTRRAALALLSALGLTSALADEIDAKKKLKKKCKKKCGPCRKCKKGKCKPKPDGTDCGNGQVCQSGQCICPTDCCADSDCASDQVCLGGQCVCATECCADGDCDSDCAACDAGQCVSTCPEGEVCQGDTCVANCPGGQKECNAVCIPDNQCCGGCPAGQTCCTNVVECKDTRNDRDFCGGCANHQCPGGAFCANGACSVQCNTIGAVCFQPNCKCGSRVDPAHNGEKVCAEVISCDFATVCTTDASCNPPTLGFGQVCASGICSGKNVCAKPCA
jgi:hypothetical protein